MAYCCTVVQNCVKNYFVSFFFLFFVFLPSYIPVTASPCFLFIYFFQLFLLLLAFFLFYFLLFVLVVLCFVRERSYRLQVHLVFFFSTLSFLCCCFLSFFFLYFSCSLYLLYLSLTGLPRFLLLFIFSNSFFSLFLFSFSMFFSFLLDLFRAWEKVVRSGGVPQQPSQKVNGASYSFTHFFVTEHYFLFVPTLSFSSLWFHFFSCIYFVRERRWSEVAEHRSNLRRKWTARLQWVTEDVEVWRGILAVRSLVLKPQEVSKNIKRGVWGGYSYLWT